MKGNIDEGINKVLEPIERIQKPYRRGIIKGMYTGFLEMPVFDIEGVVQAYRSRKHDIKTSDIRFDEGYTLGFKGLPSKQKEELYGFYLGTLVGALCAATMGFKPWGVGGGIDIANWVERKYREAVAEDKARAGEMNPDVWKLP